MSLTNDSQVAVLKKVVSYDLVDVVAKFSYVFEGKQVSAFRDAGSAETGYAYQVCPLSKGKICVVVKNKLRIIDLVKKDIKIIDVKGPTHVSQITEIKENVVAVGFMDKSDIEIWNLSKNKIRSELSYNERDQTIKKMIALPNDRLMVIYTRRPRDTMVIWDLKHGTYSRINLVHIREIASIDKYDQDSVIIIFQHGRVEESLETKEEDIVAQTDDSLRLVKNKKMSSRVEPQKIVQKEIETPLLENLEEGDIYALEESDLDHDKEAVVAKFNFNTMRLTFLQKFMTSGANKKLIVLPSGKFLVDTSIDTVAFGNSQNLIHLFMQEIFTFCLVGPLGNRVAAANNRSICVYDMESLTFVKNIRSPIKISTSTALLTGELVTFSQKGEIVVYK